MWKIKTDSQKLSFHLHMHTVAHMSVYRQYNRKKKNILRQHSVGGVATDAPTHPCKTPNPGALTAKKTLRITHTQNKETGPL